MRNLQECQAEIFRRSNLRIRRRKRRILTACIPVVLGIGIATLALWRSPEKASDIALPENISAELSSSTALSLSSVRIEGGGITLCCTDPEKAVEILTFVEQLSQGKKNPSLEEPEVTPETYGEIFDGDTNRGLPVGGLGDGSEQDGLLQQTTLTFLYQDGSTHIYQLTDTQLQNTATGQILTLSPEEADALRQLLQLAD